MAEDEKFPELVPEERVKERVIRIKRAKPPEVSPEKITQPTVEIDISIPQTEPCCKNVCEDLNEEINARKKILDTSRTRIFRTGPPYTSDLPPVIFVEQPFPSTQPEVDALENFRNRLKDRKICSCVEKKRVLLSDAPEIKTERKIFPTILSPSLVRGIKSGTPIPVTKELNGCCTEVCRTLNGQIKSLDNQLYNEEQKILSEIISSEEKKQKRKKTIALTPEDEEKLARQMKRYEGEAKWRITKSEKFSDLAYQSHMLKKYRTYMKNNDICKCEE